MGSHRLSVVAGGVLCLALAPPLGGAEPAPGTDQTGPKGGMKTAAQLAARIDHHVAAQGADKGVKPAPLADDAEFIRRVYLDLVGRIPRVPEVRDFLADKSDDKRAQLVERLLADGESRYYANHFTNVWRTLMVPQTNNQQLQGFANGLDAWLRRRLRDNIGYDQMVREILTASVTFGQPQGGRPGVPADPTPLAFYQFNEYKPENLAAATSRLFLGVKLECAQCHDHPFAKWSRDQFWQYAAFFAGIQTRGGRGGAFGQPLDTPAQREITIAGTDKKVQARFLDGKEPEWKDGVSTRATLAEWITTADNPFFARAAANRVWAHFFGAGLIDPVDEPSDDNPPSHPQLLDELGQAFAASNFDLKFLMRAITASKAYQVTSALTDPSQADPRLLGRMNLKGLTPEQLFDSLAAATSYREQPNPNLRFGINTPRGEFLARFANHSDKRTEYTTSILQALSLMNGRFIADATDLVRSEALAAVVDAPFLDTPEKKIEALYLATLTRKPRPEERERFAKYVENGGPSGDSKQALADVFWVLLNSSEFILNH